MKRNFGNGEDAVSPVIGVILMVAIAVILAAVFGSSLFGMGSSIKRTYVVAATASQPSQDTIDVTYYGGPDHNSVESITVMVNGLHVDDDADSGNASAIADVDPGIRSQFQITATRPRITGSRTSMAAISRSPVTEITSLWQQGSLTAPNGSSSTLMCDPAAVAKPSTLISPIPEVQIVPVFAGLASCFSTDQKKLKRLIVGTQTFKCVGFEVELGV